MKIKLMLPGLALSVFILGGCQATPVHPEANSVVITRQAAPKECKFLGTVTSNQGGTFAGGWTSNRSLAQGANNDMKNKAHVLGGNYVVLDDSRSGSSFGKTWGLSTAQADFTNQGNVYRCPENPASF